MLLTEIYFNNFYISGIAFVVLSNILLIYSNLKP